MIGVRDHFVFYDILDNSDSIHIDLRVDDTDKLPHKTILDNGANVENSKDGCNLFFRQ